MGELSAVNAIAGAYAERAPVVHIVGTPSRSLQKSRARVHHTLNDGDFDKFGQMQEPVTVAQAVISDARTGPDEIDTALQQCLLHSRPVRIAIPTDMVEARVPAARLKVEIPVPFTAPEQPSEKLVSSRILERMYAAKSPVILVDGETPGFDILDEVQHLIKVSKWPTLVSEFGKGLVDETWPNYFGVFSPVQKSFVDSCDLVLCFGPHHSSTNSFGQTTVPNAKITISFTGTSVVLDGEEVRDIPAKNIVSKLVRQLDSAKLKQQLPERPVQAKVEATPAPSDSELVSQAGGFWQRVNSLLREGDIVLGETGTAGFGVREFKLPSHTRLMNPVTWLSIGYMLPATLGVSVAQRDLVAQKAYHGLENQRAILFIGDGSLQMTVQEISTMIHQKLNIIIFVLNNDGYTVERYVHGRKAKYNDVAPWRYLAAPQLFGADEEGEFAAHTWTIRTWADLDKALNDDRLVNGRGVRMVEVFTERMDAPPTLLSLLRMLGKSGED